MLGSVQLCDAAGVHATTALLKAGNGKAHHWVNDLSPPLSPFFVLLLQGLNLLDLCPSFMIVIGHCSLVARHLCCCCTGTSCVSTERPACLSPKHQPTQAWRALIVAATGAGQQHRRCSAGDAALQPRRHRLVKTAHQPCSPIDTAVDAKPQNALHIASVWHRC